MVASYNTKTKTSHVHHVQGAALALWRAQIRQSAMDAGAYVVSESPIHIAVRFGVTRPRNHYGVRGVKGSFARLHPTSPPDLDKLVRALLDALWHVCYNDDSQVVSLTASKIYGDRTEVSIETISWAPVSTEAPAQLALIEETSPS